MVVVGAMAPAMTLARVAYARNFAPSQDVAPWCHVLVYGRGGAYGLLLNAFKIKHITR